MDLRLSPVPSVKDWEELYCARYQEKLHAEMVSKHYRNTGEVVDYLALEHPSVKKTNQKHDQRLRKKQEQAKLFNKRSRLAVCMLRAKAWLSIHRESFSGDGNFFKDGKYFLRREVRDGKEYIGTRGAVVGVRLQKPHRKVNRGYHAQMPFQHNPLLEEVVLSVNKPVGPVPEPTPVSGMNVVHRRKI